MRLLKSKGQERSGCWQGKEWRGERCPAMMATDVVRLLLGRGEETEEGGGEVELMLY